MRQLITAVAMARRMAASRPESFNKLFMQLKEVSLSLSTLLNILIHYKLSPFSNI